MAARGHHGAAVGALVACCAVLTPVTLAIAQDLGPVGRTVTAIEVRVDSVRILEAARAAIVQQRDEPYCIDAVRTSLQNLWALGELEDARVLARDEPGGVALIFELTPATRLRAVELHGELPVSESRLRGALSLRQGQRLTPSAAEQQARRVQQALAQEGFVLARVQATVRRQPRAAAGTLVIGVDAGTRTRLQQLELEGEIGLARPQILAAVGLHVGEFYRPAALQAGLARVRRALLEHAYFFSTVQVAEQSLDLANNAMFLTLRIDAGPRVELQIGGLSGFEGLRRDLTIFEFGSVEDWALKESRHQLVRRLQERGYWRPLVSFSTREDAQGRNVEVRIRAFPGRSAKLGDIRFEGNASVPDAVLLRVIRSRPSRFLDPNRFVSEWWDDDQQAVVTAYRRRGFASATVTAAPVRLDRASGQVIATMALSEGPRTVVHDVDLHVVEPRDTPGIDLAAWREGLEQQPGGPFDSSALTRDVDRLRALLANAGYPRAVVTSTLTGDAEAPIVSYEIDPGLQARVGRVLIAGNDATRTTVIRRELQFTSGGPYSLAAVLASQSRLYRLGIFDQVDIEPAEPDPLDQLRSIAVRVRETAPMFVSYGAGFDTEEKVRGLFSFGHNNLFGRNMQGSLSARASLREQRVRLLLREPWLLGRHLEATGSAFYTSERRPSFNVQRFGGSLQFLTTAARGLVGIARFSFRDIRTFNIDIDPDLIRRQDQSTRVGSLSYTLVRDTRPDPAEPTAGAYNTLDVDLAARALGSDTDFLTLFGRSFWYRHLGGGVVAAGGLRAGIKIPFSGTRDIPLPERFFAGGSTTLRGFALDRAGPTDSAGNPLGGEVLVVGNVELRVPLRDPLGLVAFFDAGNVFAKPADAVWAQVREMAGLGLRYGTAVGPIRLDLARLLDLRPGESRYQLFFSVGHTF